MFKEGKRQEQIRGPFSVDEVKKIILDAHRTGVGTRETLLEEKERFAHVFATGGNARSNGSMYFVLASGEIVRNKIFGEKDISVLHSHYFFVSAADTKRFNDFFASGMGSEPLASVPFTPQLLPESGGSVIDYEKAGIFMDAARAQGLLLEDSDQPRPVILRDMSAGRHRSSPIETIIR